MNKYWNYNLEEAPLYQSVLVHIRGKGLTVATKRSEKDSPDGWCHQYAFELYDEPNRGVVAFHIPESCDY